MPPEAFFPRGNTPPLSHPSPPLRFSCRPGRCDGDRGNFHADFGLVPCFLYHDQAPCRWSLWRPYPGIRSRCGSRHDTAPGGWPFHLVFSTVFKTAHGEMSDLLCYIFVNTTLFHLHRASPELAEGMEKGVETASRKGWASLPRPPPSIAPATVLG